MHEVQPIIIYIGVIPLYYIRYNPYRLEDCLNSLKHTLFLDEVEVLLNQLC